MAKTKLTQPQFLNHYIRVEKSLKEQQLKSSESVDFIHAHIWNWFKRKFKNVFMKENRKKCLFKANQICGQYACQQIIF